MTIRYNKVMSRTYKCEHPPKPRDARFEEGICEILTKSLSMHRA